MRNIVLIGDVLQKLNEIPDAIVQCCVTSPPYYMLRNYGHTGQIGLEKTPEEYIAKMVDVFRGVKRVLRNDGTLWLNLGDSYNGSGKGGGTGGRIQSGNRGSLTGKPVRTSTVKRKELIGIPWRIVFALQADGWYLRSDIIWHKSSVMPESVDDRPTRAHEYIFLLTKRPNYYYDSDAVREPAAYDWRKDETFKGARKNYGGVIPGGKPHTFAQKGHVRWVKNDNGERTRNLRSVWQFSPKPFSGAHFATFPPELPTRCIKAGTSNAGACDICGAPLARVIEKTHTTKHDAERQTVESGRGENADRTKHSPPVERKTVGWKRTCRHNEGRIVPCVVLDPFAGSGTTLEVARRLGRDYIGIELNPKYVIGLIKPRLEAIEPLFGG